MKRDIDIKDISDGKLYTANDMVKTDCHDCIGCSDCCRGMGSSILLDPMDIWRLTSNLKTDFNSLLDKYVELGMDYLYKDVPLLKNEEVKAIKQLYFALGVKEAEV